MSPEQISAVAAVGTFVVIAASAIAALVQLRHLRASNQLEAMPAINDRFESPEIKRVALYIRNELPHKYASPRVRAIAPGEQS